MTGWGRVTSLPGISYHYTEIDYYEKHGLLSDHTFELEWV